MRTPGEVIFDCLEAWMMSDDSLRERAVKDILGSLKQEGYALSCAEKERFVPPSQIVRIQVWKRMEPADVSILWTEEFVNAMGLGASLGLGEFPMDTLVKVLSLGGDVLVESPVTAGELAWVESDDDFGSWTITTEPR
jgi:hypothetical protein